MRSPRAPQEVLRPLQLSLETKSDRLKSRALAIAQNLIANHALPAEASEAVIAMLGQVGRNTDENVQLKTLQTALTVLQSPLRPHSEEQIGAVLGVCLRLTNKKGHKDAVLTTAAATVRQAVALVLSYVDVEAELQGQRMRDAGGEGGEEASPRGGAATAAQKLVEDLCNIASGGRRRMLMRFVAATLRASTAAVAMTRHRQPPGHCPAHPRGRSPLPARQARRRSGSSRPLCRAPSCSSCWTLCWSTRPPSSASCRPSRPHCLCA